MRPQRVDDGLPAVRVPGRCLPDVPDRAGKAGRAEIRHLEDGWQAPDEHVQGAVRPHRAWSGGAGIWPAVAVGPVLVDVLQW
ncbi:MAG: hypothetical protein WAK82_27910, partial [Streptosporangiaceae bacterium]